MNEHGQPQTPNKHAFLVGMVRHIEKTGSIPFKIRDAAIKSARFFIEEFETGEPSRTWLRNSLKSYRFASISDEIAHWFEVEVIRLVKKAQGEKGAP